MIINIWKQFQAVRTIHGFRDQTILQIEAQLFNTWIMSTKDFVILIT